MLINNDTKTQHFTFPLLFWSLSSTFLFHYCIVIHHLSASLVIRQKKKCTGKMCANIHHPVFLPHVVPSCHAHGGCVCARVCTRARPTVFEQRHLGFPEDCDTDADCDWCCCRSIMALFSPQHCGFTHAHTNTQTRTHKQKQPQSLSMTDRSHICH